MRIATASISDGELFEEMLEASGQVAWIVSSEGVVLDVSRSVASVLGYEREEVIGCHMTDFVTADREGAVHRARSRLLGGRDESTDLETKARRSDGRIVPMRISGIRVVEAGDEKVLVGLTTDISREQGVRRDLSTERRRFRYVFDDAPVGIALLHLDPVKGARVLEANRRACEIADRRRDQLVGRWYPPGSFSVLDPHGEGPPGALPEAEGERAYVELRVDRSDGSLTVVRGTGTRTHPDELGEMDGWSVDAIFHFEDATRQDSIERELKYLAEHDPLTGLLNRRVFRSALLAHLARPSRRSGEGSGAVMLIDVDGFKCVNDRFGHLVGDAVLEGIADVLRSELRDTDVIARLGGDEFAILVPSGGTEHAEAVATRVVERLRRAPIRCEQPGQEAIEVPVRVSVGLVGLEEPSDVDEIYQRVDAAMYRVKAAGGDGVQPSGEG